MLKIEYENRKKSGLCARCPGHHPNQAQSGKTFCAPCGENNKRENEKLKLMKLCRGCRNPARVNRTTCQKCSDAKLAQCRAIYKNRASCGLCSGCGKCPPVKHKKRCASCALRNRINCLDVSAAEKKNAQAIAEQFDGFCPICEKTTPGCLDHDHKTRRFRGVICDDCNHALGYAKDNPKILRSLIRYVKNGGVRCCNVSAKQKKRVLKTLDALK